MQFFCVYVKTRKKLDKYIKVNKIRNKYIVDIKRILEEEEITLDDQRTWLKILIFQKIQQAIEKEKELEEQIKDIHVPGLVAKPQPAPAKKERKKKEQAPPAPQPPAPPPPPPAPQPPPKAKAKAKAKPELKAKAKPEPKEEVQPKTRSGRAVKNPYLRYG